MAHGAKCLSCKPEKLMRRENWLLPVLSPMCTCIHTERYTCSCAPEHTQTVVHTHLYSDTQRTQVIKLTDVAVMSSQSAPTLYLLDLSLLQWWWNGLCLSYFLIAVTKYRTKISEGRNGLLLHCSLSIHHGGRHMNEPVAQEKQKEVNSNTQLTFSFQSAYNLRPWDGAAPTQVSVPSWVKPLWKHTHRNVSAIPNPVSWQWRLTITLSESISEKHRRIHD